MASPRNLSLIPVATTEDGKNNKFFSVAEKIVNWDGKMRDDAGEESKRESVIEMESAKLCLGMMRETERRRSMEEVQERILEKLRELEDTHFLPHVRGGVMDEEEEGVAEVVTEPHRLSRLTAECVSRLEPGQTKYVITKFLEEYENMRRNTQEMAEEREELWTFLYQWFHKVKRDDVEGVNRYDAKLLDSSQTRTEEMLAGVLLATEGDGREDKGWAENRRVNRRIFTQLYTLIENLDLYDKAAEQTMRREEEELWEEIVQESRGQQEQLMEEGPMWHMYRVLQAVMGWERGEEKGQRRENVVKSRVVKAIDSIRAELEAGQRRIEQLAVERDKVEREVEMKGILLAELAEKVERYEGVVKLLRWEVGAAREEASDARVELAKAREAVAATSSLMAYGRKRNALTKWSTLTKTAASAKKRGSQSLGMKASGSSLGSAMSVEVRPPIVSRTISGTTQTENKEAIERGKRTLQSMLVEDLLQEMAHKLQRYEPGLAEQVQSYVGWSGSEGEGEAESSLLQVISCKILACVGWLVEVEEGRMVSHKGLRGSLERGESSDVSENRRETRYRGHGSQDYDDAMPTIEIRKSSYRDVTGLVGQRGSHGVSSDGIASPTSQPLSRKLSPHLPSLEIDRSREASREKLESIVSQMRMNLSMFLSTETVAMDTSAAAPGGGRRRSSQARKSLGGYGVTGGQVNVVGHTEKKGKGKGVHQHKGKGN